MNLPGRHVEQVPVEHDRVGQLPGSIEPVSCSRWSCQAALMV
jgi:hypothetical protein